MCRIIGIIATISFINVIILISIVLFKISEDFFSDQEFTDPLPDHIWGAQTRKNTNDTSVKQIRITVSDDILQILKTRLRLEASSPRLVPPLEGTKFQFGFNPFVLNHFLEHWINKYHWKDREEILNRFPQYKMELSGIEIHFQLIKNTRSPEYRITKPLLLIHGFPSSFVEFQSLIPFLAEPQDLFLNFDLVIPSLPGFGFSEAPSKPGLGSAEVAQLLWKLMQQLEYKTFYAHGSDWGSVIVSQMAIMYPESVQAIHSTMCGSLHPKSLLRMAFESLVPAITGGRIETEILSNLWNVTLRETGFYHIQATKPDTIGIALGNSPSGLAAYILEKMFVWTSLKNLEEDEDLLDIFPVNDLLDNIMVYWVTNSMTTAMRIHAQSFQGNHSFSRIPVKVPTACLVPSNEPLFRAQTRQVKEDKYHNLTQYNELRSLGRFLGFEKPEELSNDILRFRYKMISINYTPDWTNLKLIFVTEEWDLVMWRSQRNLRLQISLFQSRQRTPSASGVGSTGLFYKAFRRPIQKS
ncbi:unnamed protein product [Allacma fusca]|uniref:Epoxide hydrolase N-terminal domain-containing protein n=1 Tax=Allacma fusca TaxID=39272 RepID=A0A8J2J6W4_9HEXA|nr:unnamed protein product [Allacma fusca]